MNSASKANKNTLIWPRLYTLYRLVCGHHECGVEKNHKFNIINAENTVLKEKFTDAIPIMTEKNAEEAINVRKRFVLEELKALNISEDETNVENEQKREALNNILTARF
jgi:hypothetical protein